MTWLIPLAVTVLLFAMTRSWINSTEVDDPWRDPLGALLAGGAYAITGLLSLIVWLFWLIFA